MGVITNTIINKIVLTSSNIFLSDYVCSIYSFSIISSFLNDFIANNSLVFFFSTSITLPNAPLPITFNILKSSSLTPSI